MPGSLHELERVHGLVHVVDGGRDVAHNKGEGVARERVLQQASELGLPEGGDALGLAGKAGNDLAERGEGLVDILQLLEVLAVHVLALVDLLRARQVAEVEARFLGSVDCTRKYPLASGCVDSSRIWKMVCERLLLAFIEVCRMNRFFSPRFISSRQSR